MGTETESVKKKKFIPHPKKWAPRFDYIEKTTSLRDIVISGGDTYLLEPEQVQYIGDRLLDMPHIRRFRFASKGLGVSPSRLLDPNDGWVETMIGLDRRARQAGKHICIHTHINHPNEITWVTRRGAQRLYEAGVTVRNQSVLLNGVNNTLDTMSELVHALGDINIQPVSNQLFPDSLLPTLSSLLFPSPSFSSLPHTNPPLLLPAQPQTPFTNPPPHLSSTTSTKATSSPAPKTCARPCATVCTSSGTSAGASRGSTCPTSS